MVGVDCAGVGRERAWSATSAREYLSQGSLESEKTTRQAAGGTANVCPGPGAICTSEPGIWRVCGCGRSSERTGSGATPEVCCRQRSTLKLTPGCLPDQSRERSPLRSLPAYDACAGHTRRETRSGIFGAVALSFTWPVWTRTATRSESSV